MTLQEECRLVFVSRKHQLASTRFIAMPYAALAPVLLLFGIVGRVDASTVGISSADVDLSDYELVSFEAGGTSYTQSDLVHPTLTEFRANRANAIVVAVGGSVPASGTRSLILTHDFNLDTGIVNPGVGATAATLLFSPPLINGPGPDLVMCELDDGIAPDDFLMQINGNTVTYFASSYNTQLLDDPLGFQYFDYADGVVENISQLENDSFVDRGVLMLNVFGIAIDLDDFGVNSLETVSMIQYGSVGEAGVNLSFDPVLFMGIRPAEIPEPATSFLALAALCLAMGRRRSY